MNSDESSYVNKILKIEENNINLNDSIENELEQCKNKLIKQIEQLICNNEIDDAIKLTTELEKIVKDDAEIYSIKANIAFLQGKIDDAEELIKDGLNIDHNNFDLLYSLALIFKEKEYIEASLYFFKRAEQELKNNDYEVEINQNIQEMNEKLSELNIKRCSNNFESILVSAVVLAYNKIEYTKLCIDSFYKYCAHLDIELITINNGSTDGTKEYFDDLPNHKKIQLQDNVGGDKAINKGVEVSNGKYFWFISNDLVLTEKCIDNLLGFYSTEENVGMVVPTCNFSSYYQQANLNYKNFNEMHKIARKYNSENSLCFEERLQLITYSFLIKTDLMLKINGVNEIYSPGGFDDNDISFKVRRDGYKCIFAKGTFIHHFGSVTITDDYKKNNLLERNRRIFSYNHGVDAWEDTSIDFLAVEQVGFNNKNNIEVLGINSKCGATLLQIKNKFLEHGVKDYTINCYNDDLKYNIDLKTICDDVKNGRLDEIDKYYKNKKFDYIILEKSLNDITGQFAVIKKLKNLLKIGGKLIVSISNPQYYLNLYKQINNNHDLKYLHYEEVKKQLEIMNFENVFIIGESSNVEPQYVEVLNTIKKLYLYKDEKIDKFTINRYIITAERKEDLKTVLVYPGYDSWLNNVLFIDDNIGNQLGEKRYKNDNEEYMRAFKENGYNPMTIDMGDLEESEYILFYDYPKDPNNHFFHGFFQAVYKGKEFYDECVRKKLQEKMVLVVAEPDVVIPENHDKRYHENFGTIFTWNDKLVDNKKYFKINIQYPSMKYNEGYGFTNKKLCTLISSNKSSNVDGELYGERIKAIKYFEINHPDDFDLYGNGWNKEQYLLYRGRVESKMKTMANYKFAIAYENSCKLYGYITEKIIDCFVSGCVPIYYGAPNITEYIPEDTFIDFRHFTSYEELYSFIYNMEESTYCEYLTNIKKFLESDDYSKFTYKTFAETISKTLKYKVK